MVTVNIKPGTHREAAIAMHPKTAEALDAAPGGIIGLRFGSSGSSVRVVADPRLRSDEALLSKTAMRALRLPAACRHELIREDGVLRIGPYISFLVANRSGGLRQFTKTINDYLHHYGETGGAVLIFAVDGIRRTDRTIRGLMYNPGTRKWRSGIYGYPDAVFNRGHVRSLAWSRHMQSVIGPGKVFNDFYLDKWEMHRLLSASPALKPHLPETVLYRKPENIVTLHARHDCLYIKPVHGTMGRSIVTSRKLRSGYAVRYLRQGRQVERIFPGGAPLRSFLGRKLDGQSYIIQEGIPLASPNRVPTDFRLIVVKDGSGRWLCQGIVARYGRKGSFLSNVSVGGTADRGETGLRRLSGMSDDEAAGLRSRMEKLALDIARHLDASGLHCGNMGIDMGVAPDRSIWIIEVQHHSPAHSIALDAKDTELYVRTLRSNMQYMKRLSGFYGKEAST